MIRKTPTLAVPVLALLLAGPVLADDEAETLSETPPVQGESWLGGAQQIDPTLGERRTGKQRNAVETRRDGTIGHVPDAGSGDSGLEDDALPADAGRSGGERGMDEQAPP